MKLLTCLLVALAYCGLQSRLIAGENNPNNDARKQRMKQFDTNGDGKLSPEEKAAAKAAFSPVAAKEFEGKAKPEKESKAGLQKKVLEQFDANGNGKLDPDEQTAARKAASERRKNKKKGGQNGGGQGVDPGNGVDGLNGQPVGGGANGPVGDGQGKLLQKFDFNRDGVLSAQEMANAQEWMRRNAGQGQRGSKLPPGFGRPPRQQP